jgi:hypothetical protein
MISHWAEWYKCDSEFAHLYAYHLYVVVDCNVEMKDFRRRGGKK